MMTEHKHKECSQLTGHKNKYATVVGSELCTHYHDSIVTADSLCHCMSYCTLNTHQPDKQPLEQNYITIFPEPLCTLLEIC